MAQEIADSKLIDTWSSSGLIVEPDISKIIEGWQLGEQPPHEYMNWLQNTFGSKLNHILKNGVATWNNETEYLAGSSVQYNGNVWLCKTTNTNSAPTDTNVNWEKIVRDVATSSEIRTGTDNKKTITPLGYSQTTLGWGQTWQDVTASRSAGVIYTNTTGKPIQVIVRDNTNASGFTGLNLTVNGVLISSTRIDGTSVNAERLEANAIIPNGSEYIVSNNFGNLIWLELR